MTLVRAAGLVLLCLSFARPALAQAGVQAEPAVVKVISTGSGEKRPLRYALTKGAKETIELSMDMSISMDMPGVGPQSIDAPPLKLSMVVDVTDVDPNGDIVMSMTISYADMEGNMMPAGTFDALKGLSARMTMTDRGMIKNLTFDESKMTDPSVKQLLQSSGVDRLSAPLPEDAIGVGGKWEAIQRLTTNGMTIDQKAVYEVLEMAPGRVLLGVTIEQTAGTQPLNAPGMPPEIQATLVALDGGGSGKLTLNDGSLTLYGDMTMKSNVTMDMQMQGQSQRMTTSTEIKLTVSRGAGR